MLPFNMYRTFLGDIADIGSEYSLEEIEEKEEMHEDNEDPSLRTQEVTTSFVATTDVLLKQRELLSMSAEHGIGNSVRDSNEECMSAVGR